MSVETEFKWRLKMGVEITVTAEGCFDGDGIWPLELGFITNNALEDVIHKTLAGIKSEIAQIEEHAVICLCEKAREEASDRGSSVAEMESA